MVLIFVYLLFFFFQAEDGIRDFHVTEFRRVLFRSVTTEQRTLNLVRDGAAGVPGQMERAHLETRQLEALFVLHTACEAGDALSLGGVCDHLHRRSAQRQVATDVIAMMVRAEDRFEPQAMLDER